MKPQGKGRKCDWLRSSSYHLLEKKLLREIKFCYKIMKKLLLTAVLACSSRICIICIACKLLHRDIKRALFIASLGALVVKNLSTMQEPWVQSLGQEYPLEQEMATHSSIPAWEIPWTEEPGGLQSLGSQRVRHNWVTNTYTHHQFMTKRWLWPLCVHHSQGMCKGGKNPFLVSKMGLHCIPNSLPGTPQSTFTLIHSHTPSTSIEAHVVGIFIEHLPTWGRAHKLRKGSCSSEKVGETISDLFLQGCHDCSCVPLALSLSLTAPAADDLQI